MLLWDLGGASVCIPPTRFRLTASCLAPFDRLPTASRIEGSRLSAVIGQCRPLWRPLAAAAEGADSLTAGQSVSAGGDTRAKRAVSEVWVGTPVPIDYPCIDGRPLFQQLPRQPSQRSRPAPHAKKKFFSESFWVLSVIQRMCLRDAMAANEHKELTLSSPEVVERVAQAEREFSVYQQQKGAFVSEKARDSANDK